MGMLNLVWAVSNVLSPLVAGTLVGVLGAQGTFLVAQLVLAVALAAGWLAFHVGVPARSLRVRSL